MESRKESSEQHHSTFAKHTTEKILHEYKK